MIRILLLVCAVLMSAGSWAGQNSLPIPPAFNANTDPETALRDYPLGVIPKRIAFIRHGPPHKTVTLANGEEGWVYEIPHDRERKRYTQPSGASVDVMEIPANAVMHTYTLVICDGVVTDVLYKDDGPGTGVTATEMQTHKAKPLTEPPSGAWLPPGAR